MTRKDIDDLFKLLEYYFPNTSKTKDETLKRAWLLVLQPYKREDIKRALAAQLRESRFFPDPQSIASKCPPVVGDRQSVEAKLPPEGWGKQLECVNRFQTLKEMRCSAGLPVDYFAAKEAGFSPEEYMKILDRAGMSVEEIL